MALANVLRKKMAENPEYAKEIKIKRAKEVLEHWATETGMSKDGIDISYKGMEAIAIVNGVEYTTMLDALEAANSEVEMATTVKDFFESNQNDDIAIIEKNNDGTPALWIENNNRILTVVDNNASARELGYRDDSDLDINQIRAEWVGSVK